MDTIREVFYNLRHPPQAIPAGMYAFQAPAELPVRYRLHLRVEPGGSGILIVNAATILHLNQTAVIYAYALVLNQSENKAIKEITRRYRVSEETARQDYRDFVERIETLVSMPDLDPVLFLDVERVTPFSKDITAPYRLDCALTYRLPQPTPPGTTPYERVKRELTTQEWFEVITKAQSVGIPHIVFTGGEATLRDDLPELIAHAEKHNLVTGLISDGLRCAHTGYLESLLQTGLDHIMMVFDPENETSWQALDNLLAADLFTAVHLTIEPTNLDQLSDLIRKLASKGVKAISLTTSDKELESALMAARELVASSNLELVWNLPVPYSAHHPVAFELAGRELPQGAGRAWLYVEPDGDVLPTQGENRVLGNLLSDAWEEIWKS